MPILTDEIVVTNHVTRDSTLLSHSGPLAPTTGGYSQRAVQVSPDGRYLLYVVLPEDKTYQPFPDNEIFTEEGISLRLRDASGRDRALISGNVGDFRFSPRSEWVAALVDNQLWLFSVDHPASEKLADFDSPQWLEWSARGIVVLDQRASDGASVVDLVDTRGTGLAHIPLPETPLTRITTGAATDRVVMFSGPDPRTGEGLILTMDLSAPHKPPQRVGSFQGDPVLNAEMAPDGREFTFAESNATWIIREHEPPKRIRWVKNAHSIWYTPSGDLVTADANTAVAFRNGQVWSIRARSEAFKTLRIRRDAEGFVFVQGNRVRSWNPWTNTTRTLGQVNNTHVLVSADSYGGGLVFWTTKKPKKRYKNKSLQQKSLSQNRY